MRLKFIALAAAALAACQSEPPTVAAPEGPVKVSARPTIENCQMSSMPRCSFINRQTAAVAQLLTDLSATCTPAGSPSADEACMKRGLWESLQTSAAARQSCSAQDFTTYLLCLTTVARSYDIAAHAGWEYARAFDWGRLGTEKDAMRAIFARSEETCKATSGARRDRCYGEALATQLGLPGEDAIACADASHRQEVEHCLLSAHGFRFMEAAAGRI
jgi:hypothetical protein